MAGKRKGKGKAKWRAGMRLYDKTNKIAVKILSMRTYPIVWVYPAGGIGSSYQLGCLELRPLTKREARR